MFVIVAKLVPLLHNYSKKKKQGFNVKFKNKIKLKKQTNKKKNKEGEVSVRHLVLSSYLQSCSSVIWNTKVNG